MRKVGDILYFKRRITELYKEDSYEFCKLRVIKANKTSYYAVKDLSDKEIRFKQRKDAYSPQVTFFGYSDNYQFLSLDEDLSKKMYKTSVKSEFKKKKMIDFIKYNVTRMKDLSEEDIISIIEVLGKKEEDFEVEDSQISI